VSGPNRHRIVILCGPSLTHKNTCATLIRSGLNVVGICEADQRTAGLPLSYVVRSVRRKGLGVTLSRVGARLLYSFLNSRKDQEIFSRLFDERVINETILKWDGEIHRTKNYSAPRTINWLREMDADIFVAHTPYWIGKRVRGLPKTGMVLGGHPGITPFYRGSHSAFWAVYNGSPEDLGCTVFLLDDGVDTGDIVAQDRIPFERADSFFTLCWKGMIRLAEMQASILQDLDRGIEIPRQRVSAPENTEFDNPKLSEYLRYCYRQRWIR
jgi:methionyl-tRNA formyltransferase